MKNRITLLFALLLLGNLVGAADEPAQKVEFPSFRMQEIETGLKVGYAVLLEDLNGDKKNDIIVVDKTRVVWYENPTWKRRTIIEGQTKPDNVCIAAYDIDGDGQLDLALGADWNPSNTKSGGTVQWLKRGKTLDEQWTLYPIGEEPTVHRMRFIDIDGDGRAELIVVPLHGRNATAKGNWTDGSPVRILAFRIPKDPTKDRWEPTVLDESLHVIHNFYPTGGRKGMDILCASYEGVTLLTHDAAGKWRSRLIGTGNQDNPKSNRGASEITEGGLKEVRRYIATIEPWHGHQVVVYTPPADPSQKLWDRRVLDDRLKWGHAVKVAGLVGHEDLELIVGVRDDLSQKPGERRGVRVYKAADSKATQWERLLIDEGGVAVEDLAVGHLDGNGKPDIVAVGRQTGNIRIYWNEGTK